MNRPFLARLEACPRLPSIPAVALQVLHLCQSPDVDLDAIATAILQDPALAAKLLRTANSASFATRGKVNSVMRSVALVGTNATLAVALSFSLVRGRRRNDATGFDHVAFWRRSVFAALAGRALAEALEVDPEEAFLAGLLQDVGMLAMNETFPAEYATVVSAAQGDHGVLAELEAESFGANHVEAGRFLAARWNLPRSLTDAIGASHVYLGPAGQPPDLLTITFLSGRLADAWVGPAGVDGPERELARDSQAASIPLETVTSALVRMATAVPETSAEFELDLCGPERVAEMLASARRASESRGLRSTDATEATWVNDIRVLLADADAHASAGGTPASVVVAIGGASTSGRSAMVQALRRGDLVGRDGDDLVAILFETGTVGAAAAAGRVRDRARASGLQLVLGVAEVGGRGEGGVQEVLRRAVASVERAPILREST